MQIDKSPRHSKITGDFAEHLVLYWLSKYGIECGRFDHVGIDIVAKNHLTGEMMGISVKSRSRTEGTETTSVNITAGDVTKAKKACIAFGLKLHFAIVVDGADLIRCCILPVETLTALYPSAGKKTIGWRMTDKANKEYEENSTILRFEFQTKTSRWWTQGASQ